MSEIIVKKKRVTFEKVKLCDVDITYKQKLKDKGEKYYTKIKIKGKNNKDIDRTLISIKLKYKDYNGVDKEKSNVIIVTDNSFSDDVAVDTFIQEQIFIIERNIRDAEAARIFNTFADIGYPHGLVICSEEYDD